MNYYVQNASNKDSVRRFYDETDSLSPYLEVHDKSFVDIALCRFIERQFSYAQYVDILYL